MRISIAAVAASLLVTACGDTSTGETASDDGPPERIAGEPVIKAGLWEIRREQFGTKEAIRICTSEPLGGDAPYLGTETQEGCEKQRETVPGGFRQVSRCEFLGVKVVVDLTFKGTAEAFELRRTAADESEAMQAYVINAKRLGDCPAGVSDGDFVSEE